MVFWAAVLRLPEGIYDWVARRWSQSLLWASGVRVRAHGAEQIDWSVPHVVVCNHVGAFEVLALAVSIPVRYRFVVKQELERVPVFGPAWKRAGHISLDRANRQRAIASLREAAGLLVRDGGAVIIFPEGTRSRSGTLQPFKKGAFILAVEAGVAIIPTITTGSDKILRPGGSLIRSGQVDLHFAPPVPVAGYTVDRIDELVEQVRERMLGLLQERAEMEGIEGRS